MILFDLKAKNKSVLPITIGDKMIEFNTIGLNIYINGLF